MGQHDGEVIAVVGATGLQGRGLKRSPFGDVALHQGLDPPVAPWCGP